VSPPQPALKFGPVDQLTAPITLKPPPSSRKSRSPGIAGAGPQSGAHSLGRRVNQPDLQIPRLARNGKRRGAHDAPGPSLAAHAVTVSNDDKRIADGHRLRFASNPHRRDSRRKRLGEFDQRHIRRREMAEEPLHVELRLAFDAGDVFKDRGFADFAGNELVVGAGLHAVGRREQQVAPYGGRGASSARRAIGAEDHHDRAAYVGRGWLRTADHRDRAADPGSCQSETGHCHNDDGRKSTATAARCAQQPSHAAPGPFFFHAWSHTWNSPRSMRQLPQCRLTPNVAASA